MIWSLRYTPADSLTTDRDLRVTFTEPVSGASASLVTKISFPTPQITALVQDAPRVALPATVTVAADGSLNLGASPLGLATAATGQLTVTIELPTGSAGALKPSLANGLTLVASGNSATDARKLVIRGDAQAVARFLGTPSAIRWLAPTGSTLPVSITVSARTATQLVATSRSRPPASRWCR